jgi:protein-tyrosine-phosphatase/predicted ATP-grasp superfamily ATP-dependent carboligase
MTGAVNARLVAEVPSRATPRERPAGPAQASAAAVHGTRVLVLGEDTRSFLGVVRSLGRRGFEVHAAPSDFSSPALASRYIAALHRLPPYSLSPETWVEALRRLVGQHGFELIVPCTDPALIPLAHHAQAFAGVGLALPNPEALATLFDKAETRRVAGAAGVPVARGRELRSGEDAQRLATEFGLPLALKPRRSYRLGQAVSKTSVKIVDNVEGLAEALGEVREASDWLVEAFFDGEGVGVSVLARHGEIAMAFQHRRLHEASASGGSSSRISEALDPHLLAATETLARAVRLHGVAMFEYRQEPRSSDFILLEVNARVWGSLPLALAAGADFPAALCDLYLEGEAPADRGYRAGVVRRALTSEYYRIVAESEHQASLPARAVKLAAGLSRLAGSLASGDGFDSYAPDDPRPWRTERRDLLAWIARAAVKRLPHAGRRRRLRRAIARLLARPARPVIVLCHGNICRSPFAAQLLAARAAAAGLRLDVVSAGTIPLSGRRSPDEAVAAAARRGIDLAGHRSACLSPEEAEAAAAVILFDGRNEAELRRIGARNVNALRLGDLVGERELGDPYGGGAEAFDACYERIEQAVDRLVDALVAARASR